MTATAVLRASAVLSPLAGQIGIVTGASSGIGRAIAVELARAGAQVLVGYSEHAGQAAETVREIVAFNGQAEAIHIDVSDSASVSEFADLADEVQPSFLINNAGITAGRSVRNTTLAQWQRCLDVNLTGAFRMMHAVLPGMIERHYGRIINLTSVLGLSGRLGPASYAASKAGIVGFTQAAAREVAGRGITINAIAPGFIADTGLLTGVAPEVLERVLTEIPMRRWGRPHEVAQAALYLIAYADYVTGTVLNVSGGWHT